MTNRGLAGLMIVTSLAVLAVLAVLAACAEAGDRPGGAASSAPPSTGPGPALSLTRTGGFAGVDDQVVVAADGTWSVTDRAGAHRSGQLSEQQRATLARLAEDPGLAAESALTREPTKCADAYTYAVAVRAVRVGFVDCPTDAAPPRVAAGIVQLVGQAVWG